MDTSTKKIGGKVHYVTTPLGEIFASPQKTGWTR